MVQGISYFGFWELPTWAQAEIWNDLEPALQPSQPIVEGTVRRSE